MKRTVLAASAITSALLLSGCAIPSAVTSIGYALDGLSYAVSGKGMTDHALSAAQDRDCALLRTVRGAEICRDVPVSTGDAGPVLAMIDTAAGDGGAEPGWLIAAGADVQGISAAFGPSDTLISGDGGARASGYLAAAAASAGTGGIPTL